MEEYQEESVTGEVANPEESVNGEVATSEPTPQETNFAALREGKESAERKTFEAEYKVKELERRLNELTNPKEAPVEEKILDFSDAIDSGPLKQLAETIEKQNKAWQSKYDAMESRHQEQALKSVDANYMTTINEYLPKVLTANPTLGKIIKNAPESDQLQMMYTFATTAPEYVIKQHINQTKDEKRITEPKPKINTLGSVKGSSAGMGSIEAGKMSHDDFYGPNGYLAKVVDGRIS